MYRRALFHPVVLARFCARLNSYSKSACCLADWSRKKALKLKPLMPELAALVVEVFWTTLETGVASTPVDPLKMELAAVAMAAAVWVAFFVQTILTDFFVLSGRIKGADGKQLSISGFYLGDKTEREDEVKECTPKARQ